MAVVFQIYIAECHKTLCAFPARENLAGFFEFFENFSSNLK